MPSVCEHIGKWEPLYAAGTLTLWKAIWQYFVKLKMHTHWFQYLSTNSMLLAVSSPNTAIQPMDYLSFCHKSASWQLFLKKFSHLCIGHMYKDVLCNILYHSGKLIEAKCPLLGWWMNKIGYVLITKYYIVIKVEDSGYINKKISSRPIFEWIKEGYRIINILKVATCVHYKHI